METEELKEILVEQSGIKSDSFDIEEGKLLLHINMTDISLPEGECEYLIIRLKQTCY